jgi:hypothetical protein
MAHAPHHDRKKYEDGRHVFPRTNLQYLPHTLIKFIKPEEDGVVAADRSLRRTKGSVVE